MHFAAVAYVGESTLEPLRYVSLPNTVQHLLFSECCLLIGSLNYCNTCCNFFEHKKEIVYDTFHRKMMWWGLEKKKVSTRHIDVMKSMYDGVVTEVKTIDLEMDMCLLFH